jgi:DNA repair protein RecO (recombination protein O)
MATGHGVRETEAFVLRTYKLSEADKIAVLLTREAGVVRGVARGARRLKSRFGAGLEPCTLVSATFHEKEGRELVTLRQVEIVRSFFELNADPDNFTLLEYLCDLVIQFSPPGQRDERLFRVFRACLEAVARERENLALIARYFEIWMLRLGGFLADMRRCARCKKNLEFEATYARGDGTLHCGACGGGARLSPEAARGLQTLQRLKPGEWSQQMRSIDRAAQRELAQFARSALAHTLERAPRQFPTASVSTTSST